MSPLAATRGQAAGDSPIAGADPIRVMIVDDSAFIRGIFTRWIADLPDIEVAASHANGRRAVNDVVRARPDVVILDIEMPEMDGLTALPLILDRRPGVSVIMASTITRRGAEVSVRALTLGAADYIPKPSSGDGLIGAPDFRQKLIAKIRNLAPAARRRLRGRGASDVLAAPTQAAVPRERSAGKLRAASRTPVRALFIASSTGGPQALTTFFAEAGPALGRVPVFVTQHMPPMFTTILAQHIGRAADRPAAEAVDGERVQPGRIYVAPGNKHMRIEKSAGVAAIRLSSEPPINFCRPSVEPMFQSAASVYGGSALALVLTGMGKDGAQGASLIADAGGSVIAQDEETSVVWGMPGAAIAAGACSAVLPLPEIGGCVARLLTGGRP